MRYALALLAIVLLPAPLPGAVPTPEDLLAASIRHHDPEGRWGAAPLSLVLRETRPDGPDRSTELFFDHAGQRFELHQDRDGLRLVGVLGPETCRWTVDGEQPTPAQAEEHRLTCERLTLLRDYYDYLWGLPMTLRDPGTRLGEVAEEPWQETPAYRLRVTYDPEVGGDVWDFWFDRQTSELLAYRFFHDEAARDGEWIDLEGSTAGEAMRLPARRGWYLNQGDEYLGADELVAIRAAE